MLEIWDEVKPIFLWLHEANDMKNLLKISLKFKPLLTKAELSIGLEMDMIQIQFIEVLRLVFKNQLILKHSLNYVNTFVL
jgi:hypothetical protein